MAAIGTDGIVEVTENGGINPGGVEQKVTGEQQNNGEKPPAYLQSISRTSLTFFSSDNALHAAKKKLEHLLNKFHSKKVNPDKQPLNKEEEEESILKYVLSYCVGETFKEKSSCVLQDPFNVVVLLQLLDILSTSNQFKLLDYISLIVKQSIKNLQACTKVGLIAKLLQRLPLFNNEKIADKAIDLIGDLATYSITVRELNCFFAALQRTEQMKWPPHALKLMEILKKMPEKHGPDVYFNFLGKPAAAITVPPIAKWPHQPGFTFVTWLQLDAAHLSPSEHEHRPHIYCFVNNRGLGYTAHFSGPMLVIQVFGKNGKKQTVLVKSKFEPQMWYHVCISHNYNRFKSSEVKIFVNGQMVTSGDITIPANKDTMDKCFIGGSYLNDAKHVFKGQMSAIYVFSEPLAYNTIIALYRLGPGYKGKFKFRNELESTVPEMDKKLIYEGRLSQILMFTYNPKAVDGDLCLESSPMDNPLCFYQSPHALMMEGVQAIVTHSLQAAMHSLGGIQMLFPLFAQLDCPLDGESEPEPKICSLLLSLIYDLLRGSSVCQQQMIQSQGFMIIGHLLQKSSPKHLTETTVDILLGLARYFMATSSATGLLGGLLDHVLLEPALWIKTPLTLQSNLLSLFATGYVGGLDYAGYIRKEVGVPRLVLMLRKYYSVKSTGTSVEEVISLRAFVLLLVKQMIMKDQGIIEDELKSILVYLAVEEEEGNYTDILQLLLSVMCETPDFIIPCFDAMEGFHVFFKLLVANDETIRINSLKIICAYIQQLNGKRKSELVKKYELISKIGQKLSIFDITMVTYNALFELLTARATKMISENRHASPESTCVMYHPSVLPIIVNLLLKGRNESEESGDEKKMQEIFELTCIFLSDLVLLLNCNNDNKRLLLQLMCWQEWMFSLAYFDPVTKEENKITDTVFSIIKMLLYYAIQHEKEGWRVWVDTLSILHGKATMHARSVASQVQPNSPIQINDPQVIFDDKKEVPEYIDQETGELKIINVNEKCSKTTETRQEQSDDCVKTESDKDNLESSSKSPLSPTIENDPKKSASSAITDDSHSQDAGVITDGNHANVESCESIDSESMKSGVADETIAYEKEESKECECEESSAQFNQGANIVDKDTDKPEEADSEAVNEVEKSDSTNIVNNGETIEESDQSNSEAVDVEIKSNQSNTEVSTNEMEVISENADLGDGIKDVNEFQKDLNGENETIIANNVTPVELNEKKSNDNVTSVEDSEKEISKSSCNKEVGEKESDDISTSEVCEKESEENEIPAIGCEKGSEDNKSQIDSHSNSEIQNPDSEINAASMSDAGSSEISMTTDQSKCRPYVDIPEFTWSNSHQRLLTELLFSIETDIQVWKTHTRKVITDFVSSRENSVYMMNLCHMVSILSDSLIYCCGGLLPLLASATSKNFANDVLEPCGGMTLDAGFSFLNRILNVVDIVAFATSMNFSSVEQHRNMSAGGVLRQCIRLVFCGAARNRLVCRQREKPLSGTGHIYPKTMRETQEAIKTLIASTKPPTEEDVVQNIPGHMTTITNPERLLQDSDINRLRALVYREVEDNRQSQYVALVVIYFVAVLMVARYRDILDHEDIIHPSEKSSSEDKVDGKASSDSPQASAIPGATLEEKIDVAFHTSASLLREILFDFSHYLSRVLVGSRGQDLITDGLGSLKNEDSTVELVMLLCSQEWQNALQRQAGTAFMDLVDEGRLLSHSTRERIVITGSEALDIMKDRDNDEHMKHAQFETLCTKTLIAYRAQYRTYDQFFKAKKKRNTSSATQSLEKIFDVLTSEFGAWPLTEESQHYEYYKLDRWEDMQRRRMRMVKNPFGTSHPEATLRPGSAEIIPPEKPPPLKYHIFAEKLPSCTDTSSDSEDEIDLDAVLDEKVVFQNDGSIVLTTDCKVISPGAVVPGTLAITSDSLYFTADEDSEEVRHIDPQILLYNDCMNIKCSFGNIVAVYSRRYILQNKAVEIFLANRRSFMFTFASHDMVKKIIQYLPPVGVGHAYGIPKARAISNASPRQLFSKSNMLQRWQNREISNFEYIFYLNTIAGRTYNDLNQYFVFPWVLQNYEAKELDLNDSANYRDLSKPIGALNPFRLAQFVERYNSWDENGDVPPFHYGTHYSTAGFVMNWLVRVEPFASCLLSLQGGKFDHPLRTFSSIKRAWDNCQRDTSDVKELIPELYYLPEMLLNNNKFLIGDGDDGKNIDHVVLPPWALNAEHFIHLHREALESEYVSENLHKWIDLIFGYKQKGKEAEHNANAFYHLTYEGSVDIDAVTDPITREALEEQIKSFGQTPAQLLTTPHPSRNTNKIEESEPHKSIFLQFSVTPEIPVTHVSAYTSVRAVVPAIITISCNQVFSINKWINTGGNITSYQSLKNVQIEQDPSLETLPGRLRRQLGEPLHESVSVTSSCFTVTSDNKDIFSCGYWDKSFKCFSAETGKLTQCVFGHWDVVTCLAYSDDELTGTNAIVVSGSSDATLLVWIWDHKRHRIIGSEEPNGYGATPIAICIGHEFPITCVDVNTSVGVIASGSVEGACLVHSLSGELLRCLKGPAICQHPRLINVSNDGNILVNYSTENGYLAMFSNNGSLVGHAKLNDQILAVVFTKDGRFFVTGGFNRCFHVWRTWDLTLLSIFPPCDGSIRCLALTPDQRCLVAGLSTGSIIAMAMDFSIWPKVSSPVSSSKCVSTETDPTSPDSQRSEVTVPKENETPAKSINGESVNSVESIVASNDSNIPNGNSADRTNDEGDQQAPPALSNSAQLEENLSADKEIAVASAAIIDNSAADGSLAGSTEDGNKDENDTTITSVVSSTPDDSPSDLAKEEMKDLPLDAAVNIEENLSEDKETALAVPSLSQDSGLDVSQIDSPPDDKKSIMDKVVTSLVSNVPDDSYSHPEKEIENDATLTDSCQTEEKCITELITSVPEDIDLVQTDSQKEEINLPSEKEDNCCDNELTDSLKDEEVNSTLSANSESESRQSITVVPCVSDDNSPNGLSFVEKQNVNNNNNISEPVGEVVPPLVSSVLNISSDVDSKSEEVNLKEESCLVDPFHENGEIILKETNAKTESSLVHPVPEDKLEDSPRKTILETAEQHSVEP